MQLLKTLKPFELTRPLRKKPSHLWMLFVRLPRNLRIFCFQKRCHWIIFKVPWFELSPCKVTPKDVWSVNFNTKKKRVFKKYTVCVKQTCRVALEVWLNWFTDSSKTLIDLQTVQSVYRPNSIKVALATGHWHLGIRNSFQFIAWGPWVTTKQELLRTQLPNTQSNLDQLYYYFEKSWFGDHWISYACVCVFLT